LKLHVRRPGRGRVYSNLDVELPHHPTVLRPDVSVVLTTNTHATVGPQRMTGVPDVVVEVAAPSTAAYDRDATMGKQGAYARAGVPEYWIIDLDTQTVEVLALAGVAYQSHGVFQGADQLPAGVLPSLPFTVADLFQP
jgi:Uma2 family endonuclease